MELSRPSWWQRRGPLAWLFLPMAAVFGSVVQFRRRLFRWGWLKSESLPVPVVVVGNLAVGGSGKTPVVIWLVQALQARGFQPGILSRGYGGAVVGVAPVLPDSSPAEVGDEPVMLRWRTACPVWVGRDRVAAGRALLAAHPEVNVIVTDDGLQHLRLQRDAEVVVIDDQIVGNGWLMPAGPLREALSRAAEVDVIVGNGPLSQRTLAACGGTPRFPMNLRAERFYKLGAPDVRMKPEALQGKRLCAMAGIGHPERFFATLRSLGLRDFEARAFPDHYAYTVSDLAVEPSVSLVMTEKDAVKCRSLASGEAWVLPVEAEIEARMMDVLLEHLHGSQTA